MCPGGEGLRIVCRYIDSIFQKLVYPHESTTCSLGRTGPCAWVGFPCQSPSPAGVEACLMGQMLHSLLEGGSPILGQHVTVCTRTIALQDDRVETGPCATKYRSCDHPSWLQSGQDMENVPFHRVLRAERGRVLLGSPTAGALQRLGPKWL